MQNQACYELITNFISQPGKVSRVLASRSGGGLDLYADDLLSWKFGDDIDLVATLFAA